MQNVYNKVIKMDESGFNCDSAYIPNSLCDPDIKHHIYNHNGVNFYAKKADENEDEDMIINELVGSYLAKLINLDAVDYQIGKYDNQLFILSELFYDSEFDYKYSQCYDYSFLFKRIKKKFFLDNIPEEYPYLRDSILKLALLDIKMVQYDRHTNSNIMIKKSKTGEYTDLAPVYDFGLSYPTLAKWNEEAFNVYSNYYISIRRNAKSLKKLLKEYPQMHSTIYKLATVDMNSIFKEIENEKEILINSDIKDHILEHDKNISKVLKKLI